MDKEQKTNDTDIPNLGLSNHDISRQRLLNKNGSFNSRRTGLPFWETFNFYHYLVGVSWIKFILFVFLGYTTLNMIFAVIFYLIGVDSHLLGVIATSELEKFYEAFFFSAQSFTTVGYGRISPVGFWANSIASFESLIGLMCLAIATGLFYGRFAKPVSKVLYSKHAIIAPYKDVTGFQFRIANEQKSELIDVEVRVMFSILKEENANSPNRKYYNLKLEFSKINFFSLIWTVNHIIDSESPLFGLTKEAMNNGHAEFLILIQGYDDTFMSNVHSRSSYRHNEILWNAKFTNVYGFDEDGRTTVALDKISETEQS
ncbi:MAG: ion channel [Ignavibacteria bacterium]